MLQKLPSLAAETTTETKTSSSAAAGKLLKTNRETKSKQPKKITKLHTKSTQNIVDYASTDRDAYSKNTRDFSDFQIRLEPFSKTNINFSSIINKISSNG